MLCCKMQKQVQWRPLVVKYVYCASIQLPNILFLCFEGRDGNWCLEGGISELQELKTSWHRDLQPCSALPSCPAFFFSGFAPKVGGVLRRQKSSLSLDSSTVSHPDSTRKGHLCRAAPGSCSNYAPEFTVRISRDDFIS